MSTETIGTITSEPDENGEHQLCCPKCLACFKSKISEEDGVTMPVHCKNCNFRDEVLNFLYTAQKEKADKMAADYVSDKLTKMSKKIVIKL
jgi:sugar lactone lactonase YvrE